MTGAAVAAAPAPLRVPAAVPSEPLVRIDGVHKRFPARRPWSDLVRRPFARAWVPALVDVSLHVAEGEFVGLLGPNGAGKSTLFRLLATTVTPDAGDIVVAGHDVVRDAAAVRHVLAPASVDERSLHWRLSAADNLRLFAGLHGLSRAEGERRVSALLARVALAEAGDRPVGQYSSGMRQRLLIARALLPRPRVLLLDEPTRSLDPVAARDFRRFLRDDIVGREGCTVLLATHSAEEAFELCDRVAVLHRGRVLATGAAADLARRVNDRARVAVWTSAPRHEAFARLERSGRVRRLSVPDEEDRGWHRVMLELPDDPAASAALLSALGEAGVPVARLERAPTSLADLMERLVARDRER